MRHSVTNDRNDISMREYKAKFMRYRHRVRGSNGSSTVILAIIRCMWFSILTDIIEPFSRLKVIRTFGCQADVRTLRRRFITNLGLLLRILTQMPSRCFDKARSGDGCSSEDQEELSTSEE